MPYLFSEVRRWCRKCLQMPVACRISGDINFLRPRVISIISLLHSMPHRYQHFIVNLRLVIASSYTPLVMTEVGMNSLRARPRLMKPPNQVTRALADPRIQWSVVLILAIVVVPNSSNCLESHEPRCDSPSKSRR